MLLFGRGNGKKKPRLELAAVRREARELLWRAQGPRALTLLAALRVAAPAAALA